MSRARHTRVRRRLEVTLVGVALVSVLLLGGVNYVFARALILKSVETQLSTLRDTRVQAFERGFSRLQAEVSILASTPSVGAALTDLSAGYDELDGTVSDAQLRELEALYETEVLPPFVAAGAEIDAMSLVPESTSGRYVQQQYIAENPDGFDDRDRLDDAGDGSGYSAAHAEHHPLLRSQMENARAGDLLLVDFETDEVVYSVKKRIDVGTDVSTGPYADTGLGQVIDDLASVPIGDTSVSDSWFYVPTRGVPVFFLASVVRSGAEAVGAIVAEVPASVLTQVVTGGQNWEELGLGATGDSYIVGEDLTLRTESRAWFEDPEDYLELHLDRYDDPARTELIEIVGSPVLLQQVDNAAIETSLAGEQFVGTVTSYLGTKTLAASGPVKIGNLNWAIVVEQARSEANDELRSMIWSTLIVMAILLPITALLGVLIARSLTKPFEALVQGAARIAGGDLDRDVQDLGRNELGDVGRQLEVVARQLDAEERAILDQEQRINDVLTAVLPPRLVARVRQGEESIDDVFDTATMIAVTIEESSVAAGTDQDVVLEIIERVTDDVDELMRRFGVERVRRASSGELFIAGLGDDEARENDAAHFAAAVVRLTAEIGAEFGSSLTARAGLASGDVATGVIGRSQLTFGVWGDPVSAATSLSALAPSGRILADASVLDALGPEWEIGPNEDLPGLADDIDAHDISTERVETIEHNRDDESG